MILRILRCFLLSGAFGILAACPKEIHITSKRWAPGPLDLTHADTLAIAPISEEGGHDLLAYLDGALQNTPRFRLVDRKHVAHLIEEEALLEHLGSGEKNRALLRADILLVGRILQNEFFEDITYETRKTSTYSEQTLYRRTPVQNLRVAIKYIDTRTGWIVATRIYEAQTSGTTDFINDEGSLDGRSENLAALFGPVDEKSLLREAQLNIASQVFADIAPHLEKTQLVLEHEPSLEDSQRALDAAYRGNWDRATTIYGRLARELDRVSPENLRFRAAAHFDHGVALGAWGRQDEAIHEIDYAYRLYPKRLYTRTMSRLIKERDDTRTLANNPSSLTSHHSR